MPLAAFEGTVRPKRVARAGLRTWWQSQRIVDDSDGENGPGEPIRMKQARWRRLILWRETPELPDWTSHSAGLLRQRTLATVLQAVLLVVLGVIIATRYNGAARSAEPLFRLMAWLPVIVRGAVFGGAAMVLYGLGLHRGDVAQAWRQPASAVGVTVHFVAGLALLSWAYAAPPLVALSPRIMSLALLFYTASVALWPVYLLAGWATLLPGRLDIGQMVRIRMALMGGAVFAAYGAWRVFERVGYPSARIFTEATMAIVSMISGALGHPVALVVVKPDGTPVYRSGGFSAFIFPGCSGLEGMALTVALLGAVVALERRHLHLGRALMLVAVATLCAFLLNVLRLVVLFYIGDLWSADIAENGFHANFGVVSLVLVAASFVLLLRRVAHRGAVDQTEWIRPRRAAIALERPDLALVYPTAVILAATMAFGLISGQFNWFYPGPIVLAALVLWRLRLPPAEADWTINPIPVAAGVFAFIAWTQMVPADSRASDAFAETLFAATPVVATAWLVMRVIGSSLIIPITEEMTFRAFMVPWLSDGLARFVSPAPRTAFAVVMSSIVFGVMHRHILAGIVAGLVFAVVFIRRRSCRDAILAHGTTNLLLCADAVGWNNWSYL